MRACSEGHLGVDEDCVFGEVSREVFFFPVGADLKRFSDCNWGPVLLPGGLPVGVANFFCGKGDGEVGDLL